MAKWRDEYGEIHQNYVGKRSSMTELDKLEEYLKAHDYLYKREDENRPILHYTNHLYSIHSLASDLLAESLNRHQIKVYEDVENMDNDNWCWDAICHYGSYGYEKGLLETMGELVPEDYGDVVMGYLTAEDIIKMLEERNKEDG